MAKHRRIIVGAALAAFVFMTPESGGSQAPGIAGGKAPELGVEQWVTLPQGRETVQLSDYEGKVVYLFCWQKW